MTAHLSPVSAPQIDGDAPAPAAWGASAALFGVPAAIFCLAFYGFRPWLEGLGYSDLVSYLTALCIPVAALFTAALVACHRVEGRPLSRAMFTDRMRFPRPRLRDGAWGIGLFGVGLLGYGLFSQIGLILVRGGWLPLPADLPVLADPLAPFSLDVLNRAAGGQIQGQWSIAILFTVTFFFNIAGEELWWRGYVLPRQERAFGRVTWLIHGLMWAMFHAFKYWDVIGLLPICLMIAFAAVRLRSNWAGLIAHALFNVGGLILVIQAIAR
jgi:membrane protease YdiL (CAAX protease family)